MFPADITVSGRFAFDDRAAESFAFGNVSQSGSIFSRVGGVISTTTYTGALITTGSNPIVASLTHHGDGVVQGGDGFGGTATHSPIVQSNNAAEFRADTDLDDTGDSTAVGIDNNSLTQAYRVFLSLSIDHEVDSSGPAAGVRSDIDLEIDGSKVFGSEIISDTFFDNSIDGNLGFGAGGTISQSKVFQFDRVILPATTLEVGLDYTVETLVGGYPDGLTSSNASYFLSIDNVVAVPEPSAFVCCGLLGIFAFGFSSLKKADAKSWSDVWHQRRLELGLDRT